MHTASLLVPETRLWPLARPPRCTPPFSLCLSAACTLGWPGEEAGSTFTRQAVLAKPVPTGPLSQRATGVQAVEASAQAGVRPEGYSTVFQGSEPRSGGPLGHHNPSPASRRGCLWPSLPPSISTLAGKAQPHSLLGPHSRCPAFQDKFTPII